MVVEQALPIDFAEQLCFCQLLGADTDTICMQYNWAYASSSVRYVVVSMSLYVHNLVPASIPILRKCVIPYYNTFTSL